MFSILALPIHLITAFIVSSVSQNNKIQSSTILAIINILCSIINMMVYIKIEDSEFIKKIKNSKIVILIQDKIKKKPF